ncbi:hypothetical protein G7077_01315 [Sphingomonas piscis]|uniref:Uncharacterized protein n=1 Tax=Sphingomonas piscis TaxID=2714943 RepID=A0A6G7YLY9_9SPHN|nr:hypothetical protein [Sphingomonas piscis]QIK77752.1 hypothetical protein G7077_01315 [Sphingomonas piscis]
MNDNEIVARLLHSGIAEPDFDPFLRKDFFPPQDREMSNVCGEADGVSVVRRLDYTDQDLQQKAVELAGENRTGEGALLARAADLRNIRLSLVPIQAIYIYDDPTDEESGHAILRGIESLDRPEQEELRLSVRLRFDQRI